MAICLTVARLRGCAVARPHGCVQPRATSLRREHLRIMRGRHALPITPSSLSQKQTENNRIRSN
jgi:hypothetical protein